MSNSGTQGSSYWSKYQSKTAKKYVPVSENRRKERKNQRPSFKGLILIAAVILIYITWMSEPWCPRPARNFDHYNLTVCVGTTDHSYQLSPAEQMKNKGNPFK